MDYEPKDPGQNRKDQTGENKPPNREDAMTHLFERFGWSGKAGGTKKGGRGRKKPRRRGSWAVFAVVAVVLASLGTLAGIWTDYLWFQQLGYADIFLTLSLIHISEPTRLRRISYAVFCLNKKKQAKHLRILAKSASRPKVKLPNLFGAG